MNEENNFKWAILPVLFGLFTLGVVTLGLYYYTGAFDTWTDRRPQVRSEIYDTLTQIDDANPAKNIFVECFTTEVIKLAVTYECEIPKRSENNYESIAACLNEKNMSEKGRAAIMECFQYTVDTLQQVAPAQ